PVLASEMPAAAPPRALARGPPVPYFGPAAAFEPPPEPPFVLWLQTAPLPVPPLPPLPPNALPPAPPKLLAMLEPSGFVTWLPKAKPPVVEKAMPSVPLAVSPPLPPLPPRPPPEHSRVGVAGPLVSWLQVLVADEP